VTVAKRITALRAQGLGWKRIAADLGLELDGNSPRQIGF
jgi:hypothetical protein